MLFDLWIRAGDGLRAALIRWLEGFVTVLFFFNFSDVTKRNDSLVFVFFEV